MPAVIDDVRVLPYRVRPLPDEPFDSWLETMAATYRATISEMACALGLIEQREGRAVSASAWMANGWASELTDVQARRLEATTGIHADHFHEMTRMRFAHHAIQYTRQGRISSRCPAGGTSGRYCPECLGDSGGRWRMSWQFPFGFACPRHRRLLVDECPVCHRPPRRTGHPLALVPKPGRCHNPVDGSVGPIASRCLGDLTEGDDPIPVGDAVLAAQRRIMRIVSTGQAHFGIYDDAPQPAIPALEDIRLLARIAVGAICNGAEVDLTGIGDELRARFRDDHRVSSGLRIDTAQGAAVGNAIAIAALDDTDKSLELLRGRLAVSTSYTMHTPQMQTLIAASLGRTRRPTAFLQSAPKTNADPAERARKVPAHLWDEWMLRHAPHRLNHDIAASALAAAVVFTGTRLTHSAALAMLDPTAPTRQVTNVMRELGRADYETDTLHAILRLADYLDHNDAPIDYTRRRALDCTDLLPAARWMQVCRELNVSPGSGPRLSKARVFLYRMITGNPARTAPTAWGSIADAEWEKGLPEQMRHRLEREGEKFLDAHRINEPLTWTPPVDEAPTECIDPEPPRQWPSARPAQATVESTISREELVRAYGTGASTFELAKAASVSRQTISRLLGEAGVPTRRGRRARIRLDTTWLRHQYETERLTMPQIAAVVGCSTTAIANHLRRAGISIRPGVRASEAAELHPHPIAGDSPLLQRVLTGRNPLEAARRYMVVTECATLSAAAARLGIATPPLGMQMKRLAARAGGPLITPATAGHAQKLTSLGLQLAHELRAVLIEGPQL